MPRSPRTILVVDDEPEWREMPMDPEQKIARPRQLYIGPMLREFVPLEKRGGDNAEPP